MNQCQDPKTYPLGIQKSPFNTKSTHKERVALAFLMLTTGGKTIFF